MKKDMTFIKKIFPDYFERFNLPEGAKEMEIEVFRACKSWVCDRESFTPTFEEQGYKYLGSQNPSDPGIYSLSTCERAVDIKRFVKTNSEYERPYKIAIGKTDGKYGVAQRTRERKDGYRGSHVDYWLYRDAKPYESFRMIDDFNQYMQMKR